MTGGGSDFPATRILGEQNVRHPIRLGALAALLGCLMMPPTAHAIHVFLKDGRVLRGKVVEISGLSERLANPNQSTGAVRAILLINDDLRRTFISQRQIQAIREEDPGEAPEKFVVWQHVRQGGQEIASMGPIVRITPFDEYGRRILYINSPKEQVKLIQGITELTPTYAKVEGIVSEQSRFVSDMRIATTSIPHETLDKILRGQIDESDPEQCKRAGEFLCSGERYEAATKELEAIADKFDDAAIREQLAADGSGAEAVVVTATAEGIGTAAKCRTAHVRLHETEDLSYRGSCGRDSSAGSRHDRAIRQRDWPTGTDSQSDR